MENRGVVGIVLAIIVGVIVSFLHDGISALFTRTLQQSPSPRLANVPSGPASQPPVPNSVGQAPGPNYPRRDPGLDFYGRASVPNYARRDPSLDYYSQVPGPQYYGQVPGSDYPRQESSPAPCGQEIWGWLKTDMCPAAPPSTPVPPR
jgi:hypothetical protein